MVAIKRNNLIPLTFHVTNRTHEFLSNMSLVRITIPRNSFLLKFLAISLGEKLIEIAYIYFFAAKTGHFLYFVSDEETGSFTCFELHAVFADAVRTVL